MSSSNCETVVKVLLVAYLLHQIRASNLIDMYQQTPESECHCKCSCNPIPTTTTTRPPLLTICEPNLTGYFPHPDDICQKYVYCSRGTLRFNTFQCLPGLYFTPGNNMCTSAVPPGCESPDASVLLYERTSQLGEWTSIDMKWGECYNLEDIEMDRRISSIRFLKNDCIFLCDTNRCDGTCNIIKADDKCNFDLANCDFDRRAKSIGSCFYHDY